MYLTRLQIVTVRVDHSLTEDAEVVSCTEFASPSHNSNTKREALKYHETLSDAVSLLTE